MKSIYYKQENGNLGITAFLNEEVAEETTHPENVYLLRIFDAVQLTNPKAKIANVPTGTFPAVGHTPAFCQASIWSIVHMPGAVPH